MARGKKKMDHALDRAMEIISGKWIVIGLIALAVFFLAVSSAWSQQGEAPGFRPGRIEQKALPPPKAGTKLELQVPAGGRALGEKLKGIKLQLNNISIEGATVFTKEELGKFYAALLGKELSLAEVYVVEEQITQKYRQEGYVLSRALVPQQRIKDGVVKIKVVEGFISDVKVEGSERSKKRILSYIENLKDSKPLKIDDLERYLLLVNDLAGISGKSIVRPDPDTPEGAELVLMAEEDRISGQLSYDNYGSIYTGPNSGSIGFDINSFFGYGEQISFDYIQAAPENELKFRQISFQLPLGNEGLLLKAATSYAPAQPGEEFERLFEATSWSTSHSVSLSYPLIRTRIANFSMEAGYNYRKSTTYLLQQKYTEDRIPAFYLTGTYDFLDKWAGSNLITLTVKGGNDWFANTDAGNLWSTRPEASSHFVTWSGDLRRIQALDFLLRGLSFVASGYWQTASGPLFASEEFGVGGRIFGRGYDLGEILGDRGVAATAELQYERKLFKDFDYRLYGFFDAGKVWNVDDTDRNTPNEEPSLESAGIGLNVNWKEYLALTAEVAKPLRRIPFTEDNLDPRYYLGAVIMF